jgi:hypothetical protein
MLNILMTLVYSQMIPRFSSRAIWQLFPVKFWPAIVSCSPTTGWLARYMKIKWRPFPGPALSSRIEVNYLGGRAIAQAVSRLLTTAAVRVRKRVNSCGVCDGQNGTGAGFLRVLQVPLPILIPLTAPLSSGAGIISQTVAALLRRLTSVSPHEKKIIKTI